MSGSRLKVELKFADCLHCHRAVPSNDYFMLRDEIWRMVHPTNRGMMHLECVEARLGRTLERGDFATGAPINRMMSHLNPLLRRRYNPSRVELRRGAAHFVTVLAKHEDILIRLLKRGLSNWRAAHWVVSSPGGIRERVGANERPR